MCSKTLGGGFGVPPGDNEILVKERDTEAGFMRVYKRECPVKDWEKESGVEEGPFSVGGFTVRVQGYS